MKGRFLLLVLAGLAAVAPGPSYADKVTSGMNGGSAGSVLSKWSPGPSDGPEPAVHMLSQCSFAAVLTPSNTYVVTYGGSASVVPYSTQLPVTTTIECEVNNFAAGGTDVHAVAATAGGGNAAVTGTTPPWPVRDITVCLRSSTVLASPSYLLSHTRTCLPVEPEPEDETPPSFAGDLCTQHLSPNFFAVVSGQLDDAESGVREWELFATWDSPGTGWISIAGEVLEEPEQSYPLTRTYDITSLAMSKGGPPMFYRMRVTDAAGNSASFLQPGHYCGGGP